MGKHWTSSPEQLEWLRKKIADYHEAQKKKTVSRFNSACQSAWFQAWPMRNELFPDKPETEPLTTDEKAAVDSAVSERKKQLVWWFQWNGNPTRHSKTRDAARFVKALEFPEKGKSAKSTERLPQRVVVYQRLYSEKTKKAVDEAVAQEGVTTREAKLAVRRNVTQRMLAAEGPQVQKEIDEELAKWRASHEKKLLESEGDEGDGTKTADEYHNAVMALTRILPNALKACADEAGWVIYAVAAGPHALENGEIWLQDFYAGPTNAADHTFREAYPDFHKNFLQPFSNHVRNCFPPDVRASRVLKNATKDTELSTESEAQAVSVENLDDDEDDEELLAGLISGLRNSRAPPQSPSDQDSIFSTSNAPISINTTSNTPIFGPGDNSTAASASLGIGLQTPAVSSPLLAGSEPDDMPGNDGAPTEPIEFAFARMAATIPPSVTPAVNEPHNDDNFPPIDIPVISTTDVGTNVSLSIHPTAPTPPGNEAIIDPALLDTAIPGLDTTPLPPLESQHPQASLDTSDYTVPGARIYEGSSTQALDHVVQLQPRPIMSATTNMLSMAATTTPTIAETGEEVLSAQEKRRRTMAANKLKRKHAEVENEPTPVDGQRARRVIRPPERFDPTKTPEGKTKKRSNKGKKVRG
ncbi:hypothetical protein BDZ97DRAFT_1761962 [Flammula alnicola]|nr:hypothetical protein BDZ97DRAFT_1928892 [Flammula alnicola]KAF8958728.1 hypothetical protein BDZ97DRAFT_1761962 [Flammula alnicola]